MLNHKRNITFSVLLIALFSMLILAGSQLSVAEAAPAGWTILTRHNKCIGLNGLAGSPAENPANNGTDVHQWQCNNADTQKWEFATWTQSSTIKSDFSGKCIGVDNGQNAANGAQVHQWNCNGNDTQEWVFEQVGSSNKFVISNKYHASRCLTLQGGSSANGAKITLNTCNSNISQQFELVKPPNEG